MTVLAKEQHEDLVARYQSGKWSIRQLALAFAITPETCRRHLVKGHALTAQRGNRGQAIELVYTPKELELLREIAVLRGRSAAGLCRDWIKERLLEELKSGTLAPKP